MTTAEYIIVFRAGFDDKVQKALRDSRVQGSISKDGLVQKLEDVTGASNMSMTIGDQDKSITKKGRRDFPLSAVGKDCAIHPLIDNQVEFNNPIYGADVDSKYL